MHNLRDLDVFLMRKVINYTFEARCHTSSGRSLNCRLLLVFKWGKIKMVWNAWTSPLEYIRQVASFYNNEFWLHKVYDLLLLVEVIKTRLLFYFWIWNVRFYAYLIFMQSLANIDSTWVWCYFDCTISIQFYFSVQKKC